MPAFSDFGLGMQGINAARSDDQALEAGRQRNQAGQMGLEEAQRARQAQAEERAAVSGSTDMQDTYSRVGEARRRSGNLAGVEEADTKLKAHEMAAVLDLARDAQMGTDPRQAEAKFRRAGGAKNAAPGSIEFGSVPQANDPEYTKLQTIHPDWQPGDHLIRMVDVNGNQHVQNATAIIRANSKQDVHGVPAGGSALITQPGAQPRLISAPDKGKFDLKDGILWNEKSGQWQQVDSAGEWVLGHITNGTQEVPVALNKKTGQLNQLGPGGVRTGLQAHVSQPTVPGGPVTVSLPGGQLAEFKASTEATPGKTHIFTADEPGTPGQPAQITPVAAPTAPPVPNARRGTAPGTTDKWFVPDPNRPGKYLQVADGGAAAPRAAPAPVVAAAPAAAPEAAPTPAPKPEPQQKEKPDPLEQYIEVRRGGVIVDVPARSAASELRGKTYPSVEAARAAIRKYRASLNTAQTAGYARGGKVTRYGLGA